MRTFRDYCAQGELYFMRILELPTGLERVEQEDGFLIIGHSETGHHHVMEATHTEMYRLPEELYECFLKVDEETILQHLRSYDTHEDIQFTPGFYRVIRGREHVAEGWRPSTD